MRCLRGLERGVNERGAEGHAGGGGGAAGRNVVPIGPTLGEQVLALAVRWQGEVKRPNLGRDLSPCGPMVDYPPPIPRQLTPIASSRSAPRRHAGQDIKPSPSLSLLTQRVDEPVPVVSLEQGDVEE